MVNCGIERYDNLPRRVGIIDVDALRYALLKADNEFKDALRRKIDIQTKLEIAWRKSKESKSSLHIQKT